MHGTFLCLDVKVMLKEPLEDLSNLPSVSISVWREDQDVVEVDKNKMIEEIPALRHIHSVPLVC